MRADLSPLAAVFAQHRVGLVVLFGSRARGTEQPRSDVDLGVVRTDRQPLDYRSLGELKLRLSRHLGSEADVVDLATPDAVFRYQVIQDGRPLFEAEPGLWSDFVGRTLVDWDDIAPFVRACVEGVGRAAEEGPVVVARKVAEVRARVARVRELLPASVEEFRARRTEAEALIHNLFLALQGTSDLALHVIADKGLGVPGDARSAFELLHGAHLLDAALAQRLAAAIGLRNRIAHEYGLLDLGRVFLAAQNDLGDVETFAGRIAQLYQLAGAR